MRDVFFFFFSLQCVVAFEFVEQNYVFEEQ